MTTQTDLPLRLHRWTVKDYHRLIEAGVLGEEDRVELLDGQIVDMSPIGSKHAACVKRLHKMLEKLLGESSIIGVQGPVTLSDSSEPEPDIVVLRWADNFYADAHPQPADILLLIEVAESSVLYDKQKKPAPEGYKNIHLFHRGENVISKVTGPVALDDFWP